jgi:hypothetical protein
VSEDTSTADGGQSFIIMFMGSHNKRNKVTEERSQEVEQQDEGNEEENSEATSHGAAGQLTGANDSACQKQ